MGNARSDAAFECVASSGRFVPPSDAVASTGSSFAGHIGIFLDL